MTAPELRGDELTADEARELVDALMPEVAS